MRNKHELEALAEYLEDLDTSIPENKFNMGYWDTCAIGHLKRAYPDTGMEFKEIEGGEGPPYYNDKEEYEAISEYFDVSLICIRDVFGFDYCTPRQAVSRIRALISLGDE